MAGESPLRDTIWVIIPITSLFVCLFVFHLIDGALRLVSIDPVEPLKTVFFF